MNLFEEVNFNLIIYIPMILCTSILALCMPYSYRKSREFLNINKILVFLPPFLVLALRYGIGVDYFFTYVPIFEKLAQGYNYEGVEIGYILLNKIILLFTDNYYWLFIVTSFIFCYFMFKSIFQQSKYIAISVYIFLTAGLYFYSMNVMRQTIGFAIFLYALKYIKENNFKKYFVYIIIASLIHKSCLIYLPIYFIQNLKIDYKKFLFISILIILSKTIIFRILTIFLEGSKYYNYISGYYADPSKSMLSPIINFFILIVLLVFYKNEIEKSDYRIYLAVHMCAFWISLFIGTIPLISRVFIAFYHIEILSVPYIIYLLKGKQSKKFVTFAVFIFFGLIFCYSVGIKNGNGVLPYKSIFYATI